MFVFHNLTIITCIIAYIKLNNKKQSVFEIKEKINPIDIQKLWYFLQVYEIEFHGTPFDNIWILNWCSEMSDVKTVSYVLKMLSKHLININMKIIKCNYISYICS